MEDVEFNKSHSNSPLPEAGNDPNDPLRPEIDEENSVPNPTNATTYQDMEVTEDKEEMPDQDDIEAGLSDNESALSEVLDDAEMDEQFGDFDASNIAIEERAIDEDTVKQIGVHKRKRAAGEGEEPKKKKKRADKPRRKKNKDGDEEGGDLGEGGRKSRRSKKERPTRGASPDEETEANLTPEERRKRALERQMDAIVKSSSTRRRKKDGIDLEQMADQEIEEMRRRMAQAAEADNEGRKRGEPARHKLKLLPEVVALLNKSNLKESIVDPESNILEAVRFFLEPLSDGSLPAYDIQKELFAALAKLPINKDTLVASGIGKVIMFYIKSKRPELTIKRQAERLFTDWTRPILRRTDDYRKKEFKQADFDPTRKAATGNAAANSQAAAQAAARKKALEVPKAYQRARMETGRMTYDIAPTSHVTFNEGNNSRRDVDILKTVKARQGGGRR
ncbi:Transcription factor iws1 [Didymella pomorum]|uniref:Transcription factor iws1 n=1 Tax=Didymella pomorum TaxID=749634 RepID=A0A9W9D3S5_9PLEO|nr:Transcription factor iws1 [Didymella pomorum]